MFRPLLPAEYDATEFSGQTDAPEVRILQTHIPHNTVVTSPPPGNN